MILIVCLNPALDITHHVPVVNWSGVNRPRAVDTRPGGKGLNVARTLLALGAEVRVLGLAGGATGQAVRSGLAELGVPSDFTPIAGETRRTFAVLDHERHTTALFNEPGPTVRATELTDLRYLYERSVAGAQATVLSGSLPPGLPTDTYATLTRVARAAGVPVVLDAHGDALRLGVAAGPAVVKPNLDELEHLAGHPLSLAADGNGRPAVAEAARELRAGGAEAVVVSLGPAGLRAVTADGGWRAVPPAVEAVNPTGAGDAVVAALTLGLVTGQPWPDRLRDAAALGTATALAPVAGEFDPADYTRFRSAVMVAELSRRNGGGG
ncbi:MAG TPA: 1-phosphofructokinase family hexose kinase [Streptosporangiaceae bacterium]